MATSHRARNATTRKPVKPKPSASSDAAKDAPLNFKVSADFRREFKTYAAQHNKKLNQLLYEAFAALKAQDAG